MASDAIASRLCGRNISSPVLLSSGILGVSIRTLMRALDSGAGAVVTKSIGLEPREGFVNPTVVQVDSGLLNAVGLANPGARAFAEELSSVKGKRLPIMVSIFGGGPTEFSRVVEIIDSSDFMGYELNLSCPHVEGVGTEIGHDPELVSRVVRSVRSKTTKPVFAKLSPNTNRVVEVGRAAIDSGADGLTAVNTMRAMAIDVTLQRPILSNKFGGLSGNALRPVAVRHVYELTEALDVPVIGSGGISTWEHAVEFMLAGACAVQVGTALIDGFGVFSEINAGIRAYMRKKRLKKIRDWVGLAHS